MTVRVLLATAALILALAGSAAAATRFAAPGGLGASPCAEVAPCSLATAVGGAIAGDEIVVLPGDYTIPARLAVNVPLTIHGQDGQARPNLHYTGPDNTRGISLNDANVTLRRLSVDGTVNVGRAALIGVNPAITGTLLDRVEVHHTGAAIGVVAGPTSVIRTR